MSKGQSASTGKHRNFYALGLLALILAIFFCRSFLPDYVHFSNDGPLGQQNASWSKLPDAFTGAWGDTYNIGAGGGAYPMGISALIKLLLGPVYASKFNAPIALFILSAGAWIFFRQIKLSPLASLSGSLAVMLNSTFFTSACWGVPSQQIALGMDFFALSLVLSDTAKIARPIRFLRLVLTGLCVGINVIEAADIGAMFSMIVAAFIFYKALVDDGNGFLNKAGTGIWRVCIVSLFAGYIAFQTVLTLVGTQIHGVSGAKQDTATVSQQWDWATQWSMPKKETLALVVPGLFGYRMDTPKDMMPIFQEGYRGGNYWGGVGRDPQIDRYLDQGGQAPPDGLMRFIGSGSYCGILVALIAIWTIANSFRRENSCFTESQKKFIWFWTAILGMSLLFAWGRFAPFYALLYKLPYFSTIRNPVKFLHFFSWALAILFAYGIHALTKQSDLVAKLKPAGIKAQLKSWWAQASQFDRRWTYTCVGVLAASVLSWLIFTTQKPEFIHYLQKVGFGDQETANGIASFSIRQAGWFLLLFVVSISLLTLLLAGCFKGSRAKIGATLLVAFLIFDLGRADLPYVIHWDYKQKYEVGSLNPILDFLHNQPYEHRVGKLLPAPLSTPSQFALFDELYEIEWKQHQFPYYDIQTIDTFQMPRVPEDWGAYISALRIGIKQDDSGKWMLDQSTFPLQARKWQLTNTRYLLGPAGFLNLFNAQFDPGKDRFRIIQRFSVMPKPGVDIQELQEEFQRGEWHGEKLTAVSNDNGDYALFEFTGALPRAKLYSNWQVNTNDQAVLETLSDLNFDPIQTVLVSTPLKGLPTVATNENFGTVEYKSYSPKQIVLDTKASGSTVLLLNDKYDPSWSVTIDGQPTELLRCNFIMRGIYLSSGEHTVVFDYHVSNTPLYVTLSAFGFGILLGGYLFVASRRKSPVKS